MKAILINANSEAAQMHIDNYVHIVGRLNTFIGVYNATPLAPIESKSEFEAICTNPKAYLDNAIVTQLGQNLPAKPKPEMLGELYGVPYSEILTQLETITRLPRHWAFVDGAFVVTDEDKAKAIEHVKEYTKSEDETKMYQYCIDIANTLNHYAKVANLDGLHMNQIARAALLEFDGVNLQPSISHIRHNLSNFAICLIENNSKLGKK